MRDAKRPSSVYDLAERPATAKLLTGRVKYWDRYCPQPVTEHERCYERHFFMPAVRRVIPSVPDPLPPLAMVESPAKYTICPETDATAAAVRMATILSEYIPTFLPVPNGMK